MTATDAPTVDLDVAKQAVEWVHEAGELTRRYFRTVDLVVDRKHDGSPVTRADHEAEALLRDRISAEFPEDSIHGEEHDVRTGSSGRTWVIDPIDGTEAFSRGVATYSNLLQFEDEHGGAIGIINMPAIGETVWAARGHGCFHDDQPVRVGAAAGGSSSLEGRVLCVSGFHGWDAELFDRVQRAGVKVRTWGDGYGYALVATGRVDAMFDAELEWWDLAAPATVARESGATITRRDGGNDLTEPGHDGPYALSAIASCGGAHQLWVELLTVGTTKL